jgi:uncharacterized membrane protein YfcA
MSLPMIGLLFVSVLGTSFLSGIFGMAGGLILMGILLAAMPVATAMALHGVTQMASNGWRALLWWRYIHWKVLAGTMIGNLIALGLFYLVQWIPSTGTAYIILGVVPFLVRPLPDRMAPNIMRPGMPVLCGVIVQSLQLSCGVSGPTLDIFFVRSGMDRRHIVATKAATQTFGHFVKLAYFLLLVTAPQRIDLPLWLFAMAVVTAMTGTSAARKVLEGLTDKQFMQWSQRIILALGAAYLGWGIWLSSGAS